MKPFFLTTLISILIGLTIVLSKAYVPVSFSPLSKLTFKETVALGSYNLLDLSPYLSQPSMKNPAKEWYAWNSEPIAVKLPLKIMFNINSQNKESALILSGRLAQNKGEWWRGIKRLNLAYNKSDHRLFLRLHNGRQEGSVYYKEISPGENSGTFLLEFFDNGWQTFRLKNLEGRILLSVDLAENRDLKLPLGLFPENMLYIGVILPKGGELTVNKLILAN